MAVWRYCKLRPDPPWSRRGGDRHDADTRPAVGGDRTRLQIARHRIGFVTCEPKGVTPVRPKLPFRKNLRRG